MPGSRPRDLKALGLYSARSLSYEGVEYELLEHQLTLDQVRIYDAYAGAFQVIHNHLDAALEASGVTSSSDGTLNAQAKSAARSAFESSKQRFFNHLITAMKTPTLIRAIEQGLADGHASVVQIVSTGEALLSRRLAEIDPGNAKTDARDAFVIADAARTMPHTLRRVDLGEETLAELKVLVGFDEDLAAEATRLSNRIRGLLTQIHPALERVVGPRLATRQGLAVIEQLGGPQGMTAASKSKLLRVITKANPRHAQNFADAITQTLSEQTVVVAGTAAAEQVLPKLAASFSLCISAKARL